MAGDGTNRYALFEEGDENATPKSSPADPSKNPFLNQVADDSIPWQQVKKRGAPTVQPPPATTSKVLGTRELNKDIINPQTRLRQLSASTAETVDKPYDPHENWCGVCSHKFPSKAALLSHIKQTPDHKNYCNLCKRVFKDRNGLKNHVDNSWGHDVFCNLCLSAFNNEWGLKNHFENNMSAGHEHICLTCLLGFRSQTELDRHLQTAPKHTWCQSCQRRFRTQDERDEHWENTAKHRHCLQPGCDFDAPSQAELEAHLERDHFQCVGCKRIFQSQTKLNQHSETCTSAVSCPQCKQLCAGQTQLALHRGNCYRCEECSFTTHHEGENHSHITKHTSMISCWACNTAVRKYSQLIHHLESGSCPNLNDPSRLVLCLGKWWYSPLYMDLDLHAHLRTGRTNPQELLAWMSEGSVHPFLCRAEGCGKTFGLFSSLVLHCESQACSWDVARLNMPGLEKEAKQACLRRDSGTA
ncbi:hypothetical protein FB567DRAFT_318083 [Paraphoma chrysanthemicola]|uniref:C2H2-type domain-containing protein n=1 Tax=Paraphoma chrysanthemicola TaxID=798071 RepID=A0A8K0R7Z9_9PLEO|nr:hypothetical protein FB567DRAFT_318083 [Paraphoma chrysanthemicola]